MSRQGNSSRWLLSPRWVLSHLFVLIVVVIMVGLGLWQLQRLNDRQQQNAEIKAIMEVPPQRIEDWLALPTLPPDHTAAIVEGRYLDEHSFLIANRTLDSEPGYWLTTPMELADGTVVVISRGWVPRRWATDEASQTGEPLQTAEASRTGELAPTAEASQTGDPAQTGEPADDPAQTGEPADDPAQTGDRAAPESLTVLGRVFGSVEGGSIGTSDAARLTELNRLDLERVEELTGLAVADLWLQLEQQQPAAGALPVPVPPVSLDDGPHLSYAFQWFFFATGAIVVYGLILRRCQQGPRRKDPRKRNPKSTQHTAAIREKSAFATNTNDGVAR